MALHVLGINGSNRAGSHADRALRLALRLVEDEGEVAETFSIGVLPLFDGREQPGYPAAVAAWRAAFAAADAVIVAASNFRGGVPGAMKNALDHLDPDDAAGKPVAIIGAAFGDAEPAITDVTRFVRHLGAVTAVRDIAISRAHEHWGDGDEPANPNVRLAIARVVSDLLAVARLRASEALPGS